MKISKTMKRKAGAIAKATWKKGFLHLVIDGEGLVSLWDEKHTDVISYVKFPLTKKQQKLIESVMMKNGPSI